MLLPQCAAGLNGFQFLAEERRRRGNKQECCFTVSNRRAHSKAMVSPGKALTWLLSLALSWSCPSCACPLSSSGQPLPAQAMAAVPGGWQGQGQGDAHGHCDPLCRGTVSNTSQLRPGSLCTRPGWGKPFPSIFQQGFHNSTLDMPWTCFVGCHCHLAVA